LSVQQLSFDLFDDFSSSSPAISAAIAKLATNEGVESRGAIYTRSEVVDFILDLIDYTSIKPLYKQRILEPSFGQGDFLLPIVKRLVSSWKVHSVTTNVVEELGDAIRAIELHRETYSTTYKVIISYLDHEFNHDLARSLADKWLIQGDFLLTNLDGQFDFVVGNPPYVRQEQIPNALLTEYRRRYETIFDRADIYIPFIEHSLSLLKKGGSLGFICSDRWMKNRYGGPLRRVISDRYHLKIYVDMVDTPAFNSEVIAYPAITIIEKNSPGPTRIAHRPNVDQITFSKLSHTLKSSVLPKYDDTVKELNNVVNGSAPWLLESPDQMSLIRRLEKQYPSLEDTNCKVRIGVATGADKAFIGNYDSLDVEPDRKLPLVTTKDIISGKVNWQGLGVINPFKSNRGLVDLRNYPRLQKYLEERKEIICKRHVAKKSPDNWYRTIDRINPEYAHMPKLLIPDIKGEAHIVYEDGRLYPHHNLYYIISDEWDLRALQAILLSALTKLFISTYSTKMRGGFLRFQAQYLRRIRIPYWSDVSEELRNELYSAAINRDIEACNNAVFRLYNLNHEERSALGGNGEKYGA